MKKQQVENFSINDIILAPVEAVPVIGPIIKKFVDCFSLENLLVSLIPLFALSFRKGSENLLELGLIIIIFTILSIIAAVVLQYWACKDSDKQKDKNLWDKIVTGAQGTWFIPLMFIIFILTNFLINTPLFIEFKEITFIISFIIENSFLFGLIMYFIAWNNYCVFRGVVC